MTNNQGTVVVTGAARGIGRHLALGLAEAGHCVVVWGRSLDSVAPVAEQITAAGGRARAVAADVTDYQSVVRAVAQAKADVGDLAGLVNCAGVIDAVAKPVWELDPADVQSVVDTNVVGAFHMVRAVVPDMVATGGGRVVDVNSGFGVRSAEHYAAYQMSKAALFRLGGSLHAAGQAHGVYAFELAPGVVKTDMTVGMPMWSGFDSWTDPADVVALVAALLSGELDAWSGRMVRAGVDTAESLKRAQAKGVAPHARDVRLVPYAEDDPLGG